MKFNVFEGARRIALLLQIAFVLIALGIGFLDNPYIRLIYETRHPDEPFVLSKDDGCDTLTDQIEYIERKIDEDKTINITLCFRARPFSSGDILIPFKADEEGQIWGGGKYSQEVSEYIKKRTTFFYLPPEASKEFSKKWWGKKFENVRGGIKIAAIGYFSILIFSLVMGWIVRGFLGIPQGQDFRFPEAEEKS